jgi:PDZ domain-containing protein
MIPVMRRGWTVLVGAVAVVGLSIGLSALPVPYVALEPGPTVNTLGREDGKDVITITGTRTSTSEGELNLTTINVASRLNLGAAVRYWLDDTRAVVPREAVYPTGQSVRQTNQQNERLFQQSQSSAETAALRKLGYPVAVTVVELADGSPAAGKLMKGDVITAVAGEPVTSVAGLREKLAERKPGEVVGIGYRRGGTAATVPITLGRADDDANRPVIGVQAENEQPHPFTVTFDIDRIGGPSAGLMFALAIVDKLETADLTGGLVIAGTGSIDDEGRVGPIGGIPQKMIAAREEARATVFLVPARNCEEAVRSAPAGLRLVRVETLDSALTALADLRADRDPPACPR